MSDPKTWAPPPPKPPPADQRDLLERVADSFDRHPLRKRAVLATIVGACATIALTLGVPEEAVGRATEIAGQVILILVALGYVVMGEKDTTPVKDPLLSGEQIEKAVDNYNAAPEAPMSLVVTQTADPPTKAEPLWDPPTTS